MVTTVSLREWLVKYGLILALCDVFLSMFLSVLWPNPFLLKQTLSYSGLNLVDSALGRWNETSTSILRCERYDLMD